MKEKKSSVSLDEMIAKKRRQDASKIASAIMGKKRKEISDGISTKPRAALNPLPKTASINSPWTHDLHHKNNPLASRVSKLSSSKITPSVAKNLQNNRLFAALHSDQVQINSSPPVPKGPRNANQDPPAKSQPKSQIRGAAGFSIRGSAGPAVIQATNFAPGTTAEDIKHAMSPIGKILSCIILSAAPTVICEIVFDKKEAADECISQYNNQRADGRILHVFYKNGPPVLGRLVSDARVGRSHPIPPPLVDPYEQRIEEDRKRREANIVYQDGSYGGVREIKKVVNEK